jgi:hypothetical protein
MQLHSVDAIALYGSRVRGDYDIISDRDILLVDSDIGTLCESAQFFSARGYSCAVYTWQRLRHMADKGALFLQHLKQESLILKDDADQLSSLLAAYEPKANYADDIEATKNVVALTECTSMNAASIGWAFDVLAVAVRNLAILHLANCGLYFFSYKGALNKLRDIGLVDEQDVNQLLALRKLKNLYRGQSYFSIPGWTLLHSLQGTIARCFCIDFGSKCIGADSLIQAQLQRSEQERDQYCRFRLLEGAIVTLINEHSVTSHEHIQKFMRIVKNQNHYGLFYRDLSRPLMSLASEIVDQQLGQQANAPYCQPATRLAIR